MGNLTLNGSTSGAITISPPAVAGSNTITLPAATGTMALTGSPTFTGTVTAATITSPASTSLTIQSASTTAMTIDTSQNVGIGTISPARKLDIEQSGTNYQMRIGDAGGNYYDIGRDTSNGLLTFYGSQAVASGYVFSTVNGERARIDTSGNLLVGTTSADARITVKGADSTSSNFSIYARNSSNTALMTVRNDGAGYLLASAWNYGSDRLLKENIYYLTPAECLEKILQAKPVKYDFISGAKDNYGYIAQDVQEWLPEAVSETENGTLGLKSDFIDAMGTGAIQALHMMVQELSAKNDALEAANAAFEARLAALEAK